MKKGFTNKKFSSAVEGVEPLTGRFLYGLDPLGSDPLYEKIRVSPFGGDPYFGKREHFRYYLLFELNIKKEYFVFLWDIIFGYNPKMLDFVLCNYNRNSNKYYNLQQNQY